MFIVEIEALDNGAHRNQFTDTPLEVIPDGWAVVPDGIKCENFPFGEVAAEEIDGIMTVTKWVAGVIPEPVPDIVEPTVEEILNVMLGVTA